MKKLSLWDKYEKDFKRARVYGRGRQRRGLPPLRRPLTELDLKTLIVDLEGDPVVEEPIIEKDKSVFPQLIGLMAVLGDFGRMK